MTSDELLVRIPIVGILDPTEDERLAELLRVIVGFGSRGPRLAAQVGDGTSPLDAIASALNVLGEELERRERLEATYQRRLIEAERAAAVGELAAGIAHEINNPVAAIVTNLEALQEHLEHLGQNLDELHEAKRDGAAGARLGEALEEARLQPVVREAREIARDSIRTLLRVSRIVSDMKTLQPGEALKLETLDLNAIADRACGLIAHQLRWRARLVRSYGRVPAVRGDRSKLTHVLTQLLVGAMHAIDEGSPETNAVTIATEKAGERVRVSITDTGQPRGWPTLNIAFANDVLRGHGSELRWTSGENGTSFFFDLPVAPSLSAEPGPPPSALADPPRRKVLVVDDEESILRAYTRLLGPRVELGLARGGRDAITILEDDPAWDAILCDLMMPDVDGIALHAWIGKNVPSLADRVLFCTGGTFTARATAFVAERTDRVLAKPLVKSQLLAALERIYAQ
jgi:signal transduction histidine kinase/CheY-like chemotaxis protein